MKSANNETNISNHFRVGCISISYQLSILTTLSGSDYRSNMVFKRKKNASHQKWSPLTTIQDPNGGRIGCISIPSYLSILEPPTKMKRTKEWGAKSGSLVGRFLSFLFLFVCVFFFSNNLLCFSLTLSRNWPDPKSRAGSRLRPWRGTVPVARGADGSNSSPAAASSSSSSSGGGR